MRQSRTVDSVRDTQPHVPMRVWIVGATGVAHGIFALRVAANAGDLYHNTRWPTTTGRAFSPDYPAFES